MQIRATVKHDVLSRGLKYTHQCGATDESAPTPTFKSQYLILFKFWHWAQIIALSKNKSRRIQLSRTS